MIMEQSNILIYQCILKCYQVNVLNIGNQPMADRYGERVGSKKEVQATPNIAVIRIHWKFNVGWIIGIIGDSAENTTSFHYFLSYYLTIYNASY